MMNTCCNIYANVLNLLLYLILMHPITHVKFVFASKALIMKYTLRKANYLKTFFVWLNAFCVQTLCKLTLARSAKLTGSSVVLASDTERMCLLSSLFRAIRDVIAAHQGIQRESIYVLMYLM